LHEFTATTEEISITNPYFFKTQGKPQLPPDITNLSEFTKVTDGVKKT
jgi:hypothetical protein